VRKKLWIWLLGLFSLVFFPGMQTPRVYSEESYEIYIRNQPYGGEIIKKDQNFYIPVEQFARMARMSLRKNGNISLLLCREDQEAPAGMSEGLLVNGKPFTGPLISRDGRAFVPLKEIAAAEPVTMSIKTPK
jgi:hypothetical protein